MNVLTAILTILTALLFLAAARVKFIGEEHAMQTRDRLGISPGHYRFIGVLEVAGALGAIVGLWGSPLGIAALAGLVLVAIGACATQIRLHNAASEARPAVVALLLAVGALALQIIALQGERIGLERGTVEGRSGIVSSVSQRSPPVPPSSPFRMAMRKSPRLNGKSRRPPSGFESPWRYSGSPLPERVSLVLDPRGAVYTSVGPSR